MLCSGCSQENRDGAKFCHACGTPLQAICSSCHAALNPDHAFCDNCGHAVSADATASTQGQVGDGVQSIDRVYSNAEAEHPDLRIHSAPDGTIAIMFLDIEGSTAIADRVGDLRFMDLLREHNQIVREQVKAHDGFETKAEGDGFMIVFHSARGGLDCAIGIQKGLAGLVGQHARKYKARGHSVITVKWASDAGNSHKSFDEPSFGFATAGLTLLVAALTSGFVQWPYRANVAQW